MKSSLEMKRRFAVNTRISQRFLRTPKAGEYLSLSSRTLEKHRTSGTGPGYCKLGGRVVYDLDDLCRWVDSGLRASTSDQRTRPRPASPRS